MADVEYEESLVYSLRRWRFWGMTRGECLSALLRNDPPKGPTPTQEHAERLLDLFQWEAPGGEGFPSW